MRNRLDMIYYNIKTRCYNPKHERYHRYGGRGIKMCQEWLNDKQTFFNWAYEAGYMDNLSIDRIDNNGDYCPENCRWIDVKTQASNRETTKFITFNGKTLCLKDWAKEINMPYSTFLFKLKKRCQSFDLKQKNQQTT